MTNNPAKYLIDVSPSSKGPAMNTCCLFRKKIRPILFALAVVCTFLGTVDTYAAEKEQQPEFQSVEERRLYDDIIKENNRLQDERKDFGMKQKELKTLEESVDKKLAEIDKKLVELKSLQKKVEELLAEKSAQELKKTQDLAKIYDKMDPAKAALALAGLDQQLAANLLANMKVKAAAKILDQMAKQKTTELSTTFSKPKLE